jgi:hypothetical protein
VVKTRNEHGSGTQIGICHLGSDTVNVTYLILFYYLQALVLPQALATPIGGILLDLFERVNCKIGLGYIMVFLVTSVYFLLSGLFVLKIRGVR